MTYIVQRRNLFYVVGYDGIDAISGKERRRWHPAGSHAHDVPGITAIELDPDGLITRLTSVYDSRQLDPSHKATLANAAL